MAERRLHRLLQGKRISGWRTGATIMDEAVHIIAVVDLLFPAERLVVEVDGFAFHSGPDALVNDRRRQNTLVNAGYRVLRVTWDDRHIQPDAIIGEIRMAPGR